MIELKNVSILHITLYFSMSIFALGGILKCVQERICCVQHHPKKKKKSHVTA
jgi:hypothetical protein